jgi:hypothetical protein
MYVHTLRIPRYLNFLTFQKDRGALLELVTCGSQHLSWINLEGIRALLNKYNWWRQSIFTRPGRQCRGSELRLACYGLAELTTVAGKAIMRRSSDEFQTLFVKERFRLL